MELKQLNRFTKPTRKFLPIDFTIDSWSKVEPLFQDLNNRKLDSLQDLKKWLLDRSELEAILSEDMAWRYIKMTCDTTDKERLDAFNFFVNEVEPHIAPYANSLNKKLIACKFVNELDTTYDIYLRAVKKNIGNLSRREYSFINKTCDRITKIRSNSSSYGDRMGW